MSGVGNYFSGSDPRNADSTPSFDRYGPDFAGSWSAADWITWHQALIAKYGSLVANQTFAAQWNSQSFGSGPLNEYTLDPNIRAYFHTTGVDQLVDSSLLGAATDVTTAFMNLTKGLPNASGSLGSVLPFLIIALGIVYILPGRDKIDAAKSIFRNPRRRRRIK